MTTESHIFEGNGSFCLKCFKSYVVGNHISEASVELSKPKTTILDFIIAKESQSPAAQEPTFKCSGHICSNCGSKITHDYDCSDRKVNDLLCGKCTESAAISLNRENDLDFLENLEVITPKEAKEIDLEHEIYLKENIYRDPVTKLERPQEIWQPLWEKHYARLMANMERYRIRASTSYRTKAQKQIDEIAKLSPQERAEFNKLAKQQRLTEHTKKQAKSSVAVKAETEKKKYDANLAAIKALMLSQGVSEEAINKLMASKKT